MDVMPDDNVAQMPYPEAATLQGEGITSPVAAQTLLGMAQLTSNQGEEQRGAKRKLNMVSRKPKKPHQCKYKECKANVHQGTQACLKHQPMLCTYPYCADFVEVDTRFSQKRELCRIHYMELTSRTRSMFPGRADRP